MSRAIRLLGTQTLVVLQNGWPNPRGDRRLVCGAFSAGVVRRFARHLVECRVVGAVKEVCGGK